MDPLNKSTQAESLLSPPDSIDDASSVLSLTSPDLDSEDDDFVQGAGSSFEIAEYDQTVLQEEDEREKLLIGGIAGDGLRRVFSGHDNSSKAKLDKLHHRREQRERRERRSANKEKRRMEKSKLLAGKGEEGELMYEMEEGGLSDRSSESSEYASDLDKRKANDTYDKMVMPTAPCVQIKTNPLPVWTVAVCQILLDLHVDYPSLPYTFALGT